MKYIVTMTRSFDIEAKNEIEAQNEAIRVCADNSEELMPHNMYITVERATPRWFSPANVPE